MIKDEYRSEWNEKIKNSANFFKHARNDPNGSIELPEGELNLFLDQTSMVEELLDHNPNSVVD